MNRDGTHRKRVTEKWQDAASIYDHPCDRERTHNARFGHPKGKIPVSSPSE